MFRVASLAASRMIWCAFSGGRQVAEVLPMAVFTCAVVMTGLICLASWQTAWSPATRIRGTP